LIMTGLERALRRKTVTTGDVPATIAQLTRLQWLHINRTNLTGTDVLSFFIEVSDHLELTNILCFLDSGQAGPPGPHPEGLQSPGLSEAPLYCMYDRERDEKDDPPLRICLFSCRQSGEGETFSRES
jgi:hypothetical protein